jgi:hypothetical protein
MVTDRQSVGLTTSSKEVLDRIMDRGWFQDGQDVARLALALAVRGKLKEGQTSEVVTAWNAGLFDPTGEIRALLAVTYPENKTPVRLMEHLVNEGLSLIRSRLDEPDLTADKLIS